jgi:nucleotide-binding universal stress UspA family protein
MSGIICAIRGGPGSQPTINRAIDLAKETELTIHFLYVVNLDFMAHTTSSRTHSVYHEMDRMGEFILLVAQDKAEGHGVNSEGVVKHGTVREEIIKLAKEVNATYVVLGRPKEKDDVDYFTHDLIDSFKEEIESETGAICVFARGDM